MHNDCLNFTRTHSLSNEMYGACCMVIANAYLYARGEPSTRFPRGWPVKTAHLIEITKEARRSVYGLLLLIRSYLYISCVSSECAI